MLLFINIFPDKPYKIFNYTIRYTIFYKYIQGKNLKKMKNKQRIIIIASIIVAITIIIALITAFAAPANSSPNKLKKTNKNNTQQANSCLNANRINTYTTYDDDNKNTSANKSKSKNENENDNVNSNENENIVVDEELIEQQKKAIDDKINALYDSKEYINGSKEDRIKMMGDALEELHNAGMVGKYYYDENENESYICFLPNTNLSTALAIDPYIKNETEPNNSDATQNDVNAEATPTPVEPAPTPSPTEPNQDITPQPE